MRNPRFLFVPLALAVFVGGVSYEPSKAHAQPKADPVGPIFFKSDDWVLNLRLLCFYQTDATNVHMIGQKESIKNSWPGLDTRLDDLVSQQIGFVKAGKVYVNLNQVSILQSDAGGTSLQFADGSRLTFKDQDAKALLDAQAKFAAPDRR